MKKTGKFLQLSLIQKFNQETHLFFELFYFVYHTILLHNLFHLVKIAPMTV